MFQRRNTGGVAVMAVLAALPAAPAFAQATPSIVWVRQLGTAEQDESTGVAVDTAGNAFISGTTRGALGGPNLGLDDAFLSKYDSAGTLLWTRQFGLTSQDMSSGVAVDASGNAFISGWTSNKELRDSFLAKYDTTGTLLWSRQIGTTAGDAANAVTVDGAGNAFISGFTEGSLAAPSNGKADAFLAKYDTGGTLLWSRQIGTMDTDTSSGVAVDAQGNAFISGYTSLNLGGPSAGGDDTFLAKYDAAGALLWTRQIGTSSDDRGNAVAVDAAGNAYVSGTTSGSLGGPHSGATDAFIAKYDPLGTLLWTRQLGTEFTEFLNGIAVNPAGNIVITGFTGGSLGGPIGGSWDSFLASFDPDGTLLWKFQMGTPVIDVSQGAFLDSSGNAWISGYTSGSLGGANSGRLDAFVARIAVPEPGAAGLLALASIGVLTRRRRG